MAPDKNFDKRRLKLYIGRIERAGPTITVAEMFEGHAKASQEWAKKVVETVPFAERGPKHDPCPVCGHGSPEHYSMIGPCSVIVKTSDGQQLRCACAGKLLYSRGVPHGYGTAERREALAKIKAALDEIGDEARKLGWA